jgi:hypothetical protein
VSAAQVAAVVVIALAVVLVAALVVSLLRRHPGQHVDRLADPEPLEDERGRRTDPDPDHRYFHPPPPVWPPQITDRPPE